MPDRPLSTWQTSRRCKNGVSFAGGIRVGNHGDGVPGRGIAGGRSQGCPLRRNSVCSRDACEAAEQWERGMGGERGE